MRWFVMHVHSTPDNDPREEAYVFAPGIGKTVFPVPIDCLGDAFGAFDHALGELDVQQRCEACEAVLPDPDAVEQFSGRG